MELLSRLIPPSGLILVGAGKGTGEWFRFLSGLDQTPVILAEGDPVSFKFLECLAESHPTWKIFNEVIAQETTDIGFHQTNDGCENSILDPDHLRVLWANLKTYRTLNRKSLTLENLLNLSPCDANWLLVDCLPAMPIIAGAGRGLDSIDLIVARVITSNCGPELELGSLQALQNSLEREDFRLQAVEITRHPSIGYALFIRSACFGKNIARKTTDSLSSTLDQCLECAKAQESLKELGEKLSRAESSETGNLARIQALQQTNVELSARLQLMDEEMKKARIQLELLEKLITTETGR